MILYMDREEIPDVENINPEVLRWCIRKAEAVNGRYRRLMNYYLGKHPRPKPKTEEIRVTCNYGKYVVDTVLGYYLGEDIKYDANRVRQEDDKALSDSSVDQATAEQPAEDEISIDPLIDCYDRQQISRVDLEIGRTMGIMGDCLELCYASSDAEPYPKSARISPDCGILVEDSTVEHNKMFAIVWERRETVAGEIYYFATVYSDQTEQDYRSGDLESSIFTPVGERRQHFFGGVPVIAYVNNEQRQGDFEQVTDLIDAYNQLMSDRVTDKKKFVDSLLVFFGMTLAEGQEEKMAQEKFIDGAPLDARAEYIQKTFNEAEVQTLAEALVREIHKQTMTVDMSDERFAGNSSGQALKLKLLTMSLLVKGKTQQMTKGLQERWSLYNNWLVTKGAMQPVGINDVDIVFTYALPINEAEIVSMVTQLQGIVDDQTLLSQLWFIKDPAEALDNIRRQKLENIEFQQEAFGVLAESEQGQVQHGAQIQNPTGNPLDVYDQPTPDEDEDEDRERDED